MENIKIEKVVFETKPYKDVTIKATYLEEPKGEALIEIKKGEELIKEFLFPAYKVWNLAAHSMDIIDGLEHNSDDGLYVAGATGFGGNAYRG